MGICTDHSMWVGLKVVPVLLLANMFLGIYYNLSIWYKLGNKTIAGAYITLIGAAVTVINYIFTFYKLCSMCLGHFCLLWDHDGYFLRMGAEKLQDTLRYKKALCLHINCRIVLFHSLLYINALQFCMA